MDEKFYALDLQTLETRLKKEDTNELAQKRKAWSESFFETFNDAITNYSITSCTNQTQWNQIKLNTSKSNTMTPTKINNIIQDSYKLQQHNVKDA